MAEVKKISGSLDQMIEHLMTNPDMQQTQRQSITEDMAKEQTGKDKSRMNVFAGEGQTAEQARSTFFNSVNDGDTSYAQGDWEGRLPEVVIGQALPVHLMQDPDLSEEGMDLITRIKDRDDKIAFGYMNQEGKPCGFNVLSFELQPGQKEFMVCQVDDLTKPKAERQTTVYMSDGLYHYMENNKLSDMGSSNDITVESIPVESLPADMKKTINEDAVSDSLNFMVVNSKSLPQSVPVATGSNNIQEVRSTPIAQLPPSTLRQSRDSTGDLLKESVIAASREAIDKSTPMSDDEIEHKIQLSLIASASLSATELRQSLKEQDSASTSKGLFGKVSSYWGSSAKQSNEAAERATAESAIKKLDQVGNDLIENKISSQEADKRMTEALKQLDNSSLKGSESLREAHDRHDDLSDNISAIRDITMNTNQIIFDQWTTNSQTSDNDTRRDDNKDAFQEPDRGDDSFSERYASSDASDVSEASEGMESMVEEDFDTGAESGAESINNLVSGLAEEKVTDIAPEALEAGESVLVNVDGADAVALPEQITALAGVDHDAKAMVSSDPAVDYCSRSASKLE